MTTSQDNKPARANGPWLATVAAVAAGGALSGLIVGGFVILFVGIALLALFNGGSTHGNVDHAVWLASVVVGPVVVGGSTGGLAAIVRWPQRALKWRTVTALGIASAGMSAALLGGHTNGSVRFLVQPRWWSIYLFGVTGLTYLIVFAIGRFRPSIPQRPSGGDPPWPPWP
jgi:hypothetical protein